MAMHGRQREARRGLAWGVLEHHYGTRNKFLVIFRDYEERVARLVSERGVPREAIQLTAAETVELFDTQRLQALLRDDVIPLRETAHAFFRDQNIDEPYDFEVSRIYHELSILKEEHLSVMNFPSHVGAKEFGRLFAEVSQYYPERLRRVRDLLQRAQKRIDSLLPRFQNDPIVLRSTYLFRERLWPEGALAGLTRFLARMFPEAGSARGYARVGKSFLRAGFYVHAKECAALGIGVLRRKGAKAEDAGTAEVLRDLERIERKAGDEQKALEEFNAA